MQFSRGNAVLETSFFGSMGTAIWTLLLLPGFHLGCIVEPLCSSMFAVLGTTRKCILTDQQFIIEAVAEDRSPHESVMLGS